MSTLEDSQMSKVNPDGDGLPTADDGRPYVWCDDTEVIKTLNYKAGFQVRTERRRYGHYHPDRLDSEWFTMRSAYTPDGDYIGDVKTARYLVLKRGIAPELRTPTSNGCSVGFCESEQKWYGWSHRAIFGFGIGAVTEEGDCHATPGVTVEYLAEHPEADISIPVGTVAETLADARRFACAFAESVG